MSLLSWMRDHNRRTGVRVYNQTRRGLAIASSAFVVLAVLSLFGVGEVRVNGQGAVGSARVVAAVIFLALGLALGVARLTVFRHRREQGKFGAC